MSLKRGIGDLVTYLAHRLRDAELSPGCAATRVGRLPEGDPRGRWAVETKTRGTLHADHVTLTMPAHASSRLVGDVDPELASMLLDRIGIERPPTFSKVFRSHHTNPQLTVGHLGRMRQKRLLEQLDPGLDQTGREDRGDNCRSLMPTALRHRLGG